MRQASAEQRRSRSIPQSHRQGGLGVRGKHIQRTDSWLGELDDFADPWLQVPGVAGVVTCLGFLIYWGLPRPPVAIVGLFVLGLGVALLYPLTLGLAMGAAGTRADTASARAALAGSFGILVTPALLGGLADKVGLHLAHLIVPGLVVVALICFVTAQALQRQTRLYQSG